MTGTYIRRHEGDYRCREEEVKRMFREASDEAIDSSVLTEFRIDILNEETISRYRQRLQNRIPEHEFNDYSTDRFLVALGAADTSGSHPTVAGLMMFGKDMWIRKWRKRHLIDYRVNAEQKSDTTWLDRIPWEGNLFDGYFRIYPKLTKDIPVPHRIEGGERIEETPAHTAIREALVNLLAHADYSELDVSLIVKSRMWKLERSDTSSVCCLRVPTFPQIQIEYGFRSSAAIWRRQSSWLLFLLGMRTELITSVYEL